MNDRGYTRLKRLTTTQRLQCMKSGVLLQARLQYCDAMLQYSCASCSEQIAIALTSCRSTVKVLFNVYCKFKVNLFHKPVIYVYISISNYSKRFLACAPLERELVYNYTSNLYKVPSKLLFFPKFVHVFDKKIANIFLKHCNF